MVVTEFGHELFQRGGGLQVFGLCNRQIKRLTEGTKNNIDEIAHQEEAALLHTIDWYVIITHMKTNVPSSPQVPTQLNVCVK